MSAAAEDIGPPTTPSMRGPAVAERVPSVELHRSSDLPDWTQPISASAPLIRVAQWAQRVAVDPAEAARAAGITTIHLGLLTMIAQFQGRHDDAPVGITRLAKTTFMNERTARDALDDLVKYGWIAGKGARGVQSRFVLTLENGRPIESRKVTSARSRWAKPAIPSAVIPSDVVKSEPEFPSEPNRNEPPLKPEFPSAQTGVSLRQRDQEEITEEITKKTIAGVPAGARTCEATSMPSPSPQANLFGEPVCEPVPPPKPKRAKAAKAPKPPKPAPAPKATELYSAAYVTGMADAEPGCGFTPLTEAACGLIGMAAAAHAKDPATGEPITGEPLLAWIRKTAAEYRRAADPAYAKGFGAHSFLTWLNAGRPKTRKVPLPPPPEPPRPPIVIPPPRPVPEVFLVCARADAAKGMVHPLIQRLERMRKPETT